MKYGSKKRSKRRSRRWQKRKGLSRKGGKDLITRGGGFGS